ncbi:hypothetical protein MAR_024607 [Mya arenaria]|uniref:Uncharacterized protein n=1 Tax=Mya arenaria TaxID=6604 RepID=A0ABY7DUE1_MYAAR|nr:hypothetical protein MAR_024607 [Mya arenaria]
MHHSMEMSRSFKAIKLKDTKRMFITVTVKWLFKKPGPYSCVNAAAADDDCLVNCNVKYNISVY